MNRLVLIKLGGGLITDKTKPLSVREDVIETIAKEIAAIKSEKPDTQLIIGNGAGSFGHYTVKKHGLSTFGQLSGNEDKVRDVQDSVKTLNAHVRQALETKGLKTRSISGEELFNQNLDVSALLNKGVIPLVYGDTITKDGNYQVISTEEIFMHLIDQLRMKFNELDVILATSVEGVLDEDGNVIAEISADNGLKWSEHEGFDVTGGMKQKLEKALKMAKNCDNVRIIGVKDPKSLQKALNNQNVGTKVG